MNDNHNDNDNDNHSYNNDCDDYLLICEGEIVGASDPATAQWRQAEEDGQRPQADRVRDDTLRDDDGRHSLPSLQAALRHGRRPDPASRQERRPRRHPRVYPIPAASQKGQLLGNELHSRFHGASSVCGAEPLAAAGMACLISLPLWAIKAADCHLLPGR